MKRKDREIFSERFQEETIFVQTTDDDLNPWDRRRIVAVLVNETGIDFSMADKISDDIQTTIFSSGLKVVTSEFVRELVNAKLIEYELPKAREKNKRLGLSLYDVGLLLKYPSALKTGETATPVSIGRVIADNVKRQFSLTELYIQELKKLHIEGRYHIHGISSPDMPCRVSVNAQELLNFSMVHGSQIIRKASNAEQFIGNIQKITRILSHCVSGQIEWFNIEQALMAFSPAAHKLADLLKTLVSFISASCISGESITLNISSRECVHAIEQYMMENRIMNIHLQSGRDGYFPSPMVSFSDREQTHTEFVSEVITLNLPGIALRAMENGISVEKELDFVISKVFDAFSKKLVFMEKLSAVRPNGPLEFLSRLGYSPSVSRFSLAVCGLNEWVRIRCYGDMDNPERMQAAYDFMSLIKEKIASLSEQKKINVELSYSGQQDAAYRFARLDLRMNPYFVSRIINGAIENSSVYYTSNCCLPSEMAVPLKEKIACEGRLQSLYDNPFTSTLKCMDFKDIREVSFTKILHKMTLTLDFSVCYSCREIFEGVYQTCPECHDPQVIQAVYFDGCYIPEHQLNRAMKHKTKSWFYYTDMQI